MPNAAEELGYPAWVVAFAALVVFAMGAAVIYAALSLINLSIYLNEWDNTARVALMALSVLWLFRVAQWVRELDDADEE